MKENQFDSYSFLSPLHPFHQPGYLSLAHNPGGSRAAPTVVVSFHSPRSRLSPRSPPRGATSAPRLASLRKQSRTPGPPVLHHHLRHLRLPTLARATASPPNTAVSRHRRAFSSSFFPASSPAPFPFSHTYVSFIPSAEPRLPSKSLHALPSLFSLFSLSLRLSLSRFFSAILLTEMAYASVHLPPSPPADLCHLLFFIFLIRQCALYARLRRMRECGEQTR